MALASSSSIAIRLLKEVTFGVTPAANGRFARITGETLKYNISKESSKEINKDRTVSSMVAVTANASGGLNSELYYAGNDALLESAMQGAWSVFGTNGEGVITATTAITTTTITASSATTGTSLFTLLQRGQWFRIKGSGNNAGQILRVSLTTAPTSTVITLDANTPAVASTGESIQIQTSRLTHGTTQTSWTIERENSDIGVFIAYTGMTPSKFSMTMASGGLSAMNFEFMGKGAAAANATVLGTAADAPAYEIQSGVSGKKLAVWMDGAPVAGSYVKSVTVDFDNALRSQEAIGTLGAVAIASGTINCTMSVQVYFADKTMFDKFIANTNISFMFMTTDADGNGYAVSIPKASISDFTSNGSAKDQDQMVDLSVTALADSGNAIAALRKVIFIDRFGAAVTP